MSDPNDPINPPSPAPDGGPHYPGYPAQPPGYPAQPPQFPGYPAQPPPYGTDPAYGAQQPAASQFGAQYPSAPYGVADPWAGQYGTPEDPVISRDYAGWWARAIGVVKVAWPQLVALQAIGLVVALAFQGAAYVLIWPYYEELQAAQASAAVGEPAAPPDFAPLAENWVVIVIGAFVASMIVWLVIFLVQIASVRVAIGAGAGLRPSVGSALRGAFPRVFPLMGWSILGGFLTLLGACVCLLPGFYVAAVLTLLPAVVVFERSVGIGRCFTLFNKSFGAALGRISTVAGLFLVIYIVVWILSFGAGLASFPAPGEAPHVSLWTQLGLGAVQLVLLAGLAVLTGPLQAFTYTDLRARVEPLDSNMLKQELGIS